MEYGRNRWGGKRWTWQLRLDAAKRQPWKCFECGVPLDVVQMPGLQLTSLEWRARPGRSEFYYRTRRRHEHNPGCPFEQRFVKAVIERRVIETRAGRPGALPATISFDRELVRQAVGHVVGEGDGCGPLPVRGRYVAGEDEVPQRGDRATVTSTIERACQAHAALDVRPWLPLSVQGLPSDVRTYGSVFQRAEDTARGETRIWFANLQFTSEPIVDGDLLRLQAFGREVIVDRRNWRPAAVRAFDAEISICLDWVRDNWRPGDGVSPRIYVLCTCDSPGGPLRVSDPRKLCVLVQRKLTG
ncbi:hypothetical protein GGQ80_002980 [Sphingomonas jinjuensis]|uniref:Uncharacterized protein n=1 Tax=Sphingomonas jinjuensis TaxID=535907 RepID=A0A840F723_9SPHN|nr:hypothetical protein [Sphingomonas jinjuensis]